MTQYQQSYAAAAAAKVARSAARQSALRQPTAYRVVQSDATRQRLSALVSR